MAIDYVIESESPPAGPRRDLGGPEVSIVMPCLNEEQTIGKCIRKALLGLSEYELDGEIVVADNGSTDRSVAICEELGVRVVHQTKRGYGNAYQKGIEAARGKYIVIADSDDTYDLREVGRFVDLLRAGHDLVMGNRFKGHILPGAMTWSHQYIGNPVLSGMLRVMFSTEVGDAHSGIRAFSREAYQQLRLSAPGMEFASEMVINAAKLGLDIAEVPVTYYPREGSSKLRTIRDGWRHLRYMLLRSPTHLFMLPGLLMALLGMLSLVPFLWGPVTIAGRPFDIHAMLVAGMATLIGYQVMSLGLYARLFAVREGIDREDRLLRLVRRSFRLERGLLADTRVAFFGFVACVLGVQTMFSSCYFLVVAGLHADEGR